MSEKKYNRKFLNAVLNGDPDYFGVIKVADNIIYKDNEVGLLLNCFYRQSIRRTLATVAKLRISFFMLNLDDDTGSWAYDPDGLIKESKNRENYTNVDLLINCFPDEMEAGLIDEMDQFLTRFDNNLMVGIDKDIDCFSVMLMEDPIFIESQGEDVKIFHVDRSVLLLAMTIIYNDFYNERKYWIYE